MERLRTALLVSGIVATLHAGSLAQAGPISYSYAGTPNQTVHPNPGLSGGIKFMVASGTGTGGVTVLGDHLSAVQSNPSGLVGHFNKVAYTTGLTITDSTAPGSPHTFFFSGQLDGMLGPHMDTLTNTFTSPTTQQFRVGANLYSVTINEALPGLGTPGTVTYNVRVVPEPGALVMLASGIAGLGFFCWRRRLPRPACS